MNIETFKHLPKTKINPKNLLQDAIIPEMNIYNQAYLEIERPLVEAASVHPKTSHEIGVSFKVEGQISGKIYCLLDTFNKEIKPKESQFFQLLFVESMNILIGRMLTNIEKEHGLMAILSNPTLSPCNDEQEFAVDGKSTHTKTMAVGYKLIALFNEFDCRLIFEIDK